MDSLRKDRLFDSKMLCVKGLVDRGGEREGAPVCVCNGPFGCRAARIRACVRPMAKRRIQPAEIRCKQVVDWVFAH